MNPSCFPLTVQAILRQPLRISFLFRLILLLWSLGDNHTLWAMSTVSKANTRSLEAVEVFLITEILTLLWVFLVLRNAIALTQEYHFQRAKSKRNFAKEYLKENAFVIYCIRILSWRTTKVTQNFADVSSVSPSSERWRRANARTSSLQLFMVANFCYQLSW